MSAYPEFTRLALLIGSDEPDPVAIRATLDQLRAAETAEPNLLRRSHSVVGTMALRWAENPSEENTRNLHSAVRVVQAIGVVDRSE